ncbi:Rieske 2Fe-2S domain-containing protein [Candidatus Uhrbacteria bacterium]|jgi:nitrite reductase/ring-hydroxylating ferredoxin subunit|nr:MAG: Rieske 2Fe-2S domain-containing protein [Candidatus Uhrbacteria bacterium]
MAIVCRMPICAIGELAPGSTRAFSFGPATKGIAYNRDGVIKAYVNRCTHMGGPVELHGGGTFRCRWHGADFDPCTGAAVDGQAPEGTFLKAIEIIEENGQLFGVLELPEDPFA